MEMLAHDSFSLTPVQYLLTLESNHFKSLLVQGDVQSRNKKELKRKRGQIRMLISYNLCIGWVFKRPKRRGMYFCKTRVDFFKKVVYSKKKDKNRKEIYEGNSEM